MTMDMLLGRLEVFPMLMLFYPPLWKESIGERASAATAVRFTEKTRGRLAR